MTVGIMQPYFAPYIGYFQLIHSCDVYINLDHVAFMKRSYMVRNVLKNNTSINIPVIGGSQNKSCVEVFADCNEIWFSKFYKTLGLLYKKEPQFLIIMEKVIIPWRMELNAIGRQISISEFNFSLIYYICRYLDIDARFYTSRGLTTQKREAGLKEIVHSFGGDTYINAIGGQKLYNKEDFAKDGIELKFIKCNSELPKTSMLDLLFTYNKEDLITEITKYELI